MGQFLRFAIIGAIGFVVDVVVLMGLVQGPSLDPWTSQVLAYLVALTVTWLLNRSFTFAASADRGIVAEWFHYNVVNGFGGLINYAVYAAMLALVPALRSHLWVAVGAGCGVAMMFNFVANRDFVFRDKAAGRSPTPP